MKKFLSFAFALLLSIGVSAQTTLTEAVNFSSTAHNGEEIDLFEILDGGQYVLIDFFFTTCGPCKETTPRIVDAYYRLGCNEGDVYFMEISPTDNNSSYSTPSWLETYDIPFPTIHTATGGVTGDEIYEMYDIKGCPTLILIAPDRDILLQDYFPQSADDLVNKLVEISDGAIAENYCGNQIPEVAVTKVKKDNFVITDGVGIIYEASTKVHVEFRANAAVKDFYYTISESANLTSEDVVANGTKAEEAEFLHTFEGLTESTTYFVYAQAVGYDGENGNKSVIETKTLCPGDNGEAKIELEVMITDTHINATAKPNESTSDYHFGFVRKEYYDTDENNRYNYLISLINDDYPLCDRDTYSVSIDNIPNDTPYYVVAIGRNSEGEWFAPTTEEFVIEGTGLSELEANLNIYPNPAQSMINIESSLNGEAQINIFDITTRCVKQVSVSDMSKVSINVEDLDKGVYFISIQQDNSYNVQKLVIE